MLRVASIANYEPGLAADLLYLRQPGISVTDKPAVTGTSTEQFHYLWINGDARYILIHPAGSSVSTYSHVGPAPKCLP